VPALSNMVINITTSEFNLDDVEISDDSMVFNIHTAKPQLEVSLSQISFKFSFNYNITSDPSLIEDIGTGTLIVKNLNISGSGSPRHVYDEASKQNSY